MSERPQAPPPIAPLQALRAALLYAVRTGNRLQPGTGAIRLTRLRTGGQRRGSRAGWGYALAWRPAENLDGQARIAVIRSGSGSTSEAGADRADRHVLTARLTLAQAGRPRPLLSVRLRARLEGGMASSGKPADALAAAGLLAAVTGDTEALIDLLQDAPGRPLRLWAALRLVLAPEDAAGPWSLLLAGDLAAEGGPALTARLRGPGIASGREEDIEWNRQDGRRTGPRAAYAPAGHPSEGDRHGVETVASV